MPKPASAKVVVVTTYAFCWVACCFYSGVLISYLMLDTTGFITTLDELAESDYRIIISRGLSSSEMLKVLT